MASTFLFYKPYDVLSQFTREVPTHRVIGDFYDFPKDVYPIGRLDRDSEGLLLLSNDKSLVAKTLNPKNEKAKQYHVQIEGILTEEAMHSLQNGVLISLPNKKKHKTLKSIIHSLDGDNLYDERNPPIRVRKSIPTSWVSITLVEGKNRQVRKMFAAVGFPVLRLIRYQIDNYTLEGMKPGEVVEVSH